MSRFSTTDLDRDDAPRLARDLWAPGALLIGFIGLAVVSHRAKAGTALDHEVLSWLIAHRNDGVTTAAIAITNAGSPAAMAVLAFAACLILWRRHSWATGVVVSATLAVAYAASTLTKTVVGAHRPPRTVQLLLEVDQSYPSGHVTGTLALVGIVAVVCGTNRGWVIKAALAGVVVMATVVVALTRLYLGVHWLTDVVGGCLLGGAAVLTGAAVLDRAIPARAGSVDGLTEPPASTVSQVA